MTQLTQLKRLASVRYTSPFLPKPITGDISIRWTCQALDNVYLRARHIFTGRISELEDLGRATGASVIAGLFGLQRLGLVEFDRNNDTFTPTDRYIRRFVPTWNGTTPDHGKPTRGELLAIYTSVVLVIALMGLPVLFSFFGWSNWLFLVLETIASIAAIASAAVSFKRYNWSVSGY